LKNPNALTDSRYNAGHLPHPVHHARTRFLRSTFAQTLSSWNVWVKVASALCTRLPAPTRHTSHT
jgi:hypothetical protein